MCLYAGARYRDARNGMTIPPSLTSKTILNAIPRPAWWLNFLTTDPLKFASLDSWNGTVAELLDSMFDPTVTYEDLKWIRKNWKGNLVVKGIQNVDDAVKSVAAGADAIILSNHGGRQFNQAPCRSCYYLKFVRRLGKKPNFIWIPELCMAQTLLQLLHVVQISLWIGRAYLYGLMSGGRDGVDMNN
jgi:L-lactate dehydrogenase (cytochrome)/glycolate oxidase